MLHLENINTHKYNGLPELICYCLKIVSGHRRSAMGGCMVAGVSSWRMSCHGCSIWPGTVRTYATM